MSARWWEIDVGWWWIRAFEGLGLMKVKRLRAQLDTGRTRQKVDVETVLALLTHRFRILARYRERVMEPVCREEEGRAAAATRGVLIAARKMLKTDPGTTPNEADPTQQRAMAASEAVRIVYPATTLGSQGGDDGGARYKARTLVRGGGVQRRGGASRIQP